MISDDLLAVARRLARSQPNKPKQAYLRRAVSTAYYALFHALANLCADELVGRSKSKTDAWRLTYRALQHGYAKDVLKQNAVRQLDPDLEKFANAFVTLQEVRHEADYDPHRSFSRPEALSLIAQARRGVRALDAVPAAMRLDVATRVLFKPR